MAIKYKKCLKCGSLHVAKIIYGYLTSEVLVQQEKGNIRLGGCEQIHE